MSLTRVLPADGDPKRTAATAERLARSVDEVRAVAAVDRARAAFDDRLADTVAVVHDLPAVDASEVRDGLAPSAVPSSPQTPGLFDWAAVAGSDRVAERLAAWAAWALAPPGLDDAVPILAVETDARVHRVTPRATSLLGLDPTTAVGRSLGEVPPAHLALHEAVAAVATGGRTPDRDRRPRRRARRGVGDSDRPGGRRPPARRHRQR